ncbi:GGDEF domain-containing protein [Vibrio sinensis]|nr:GGDEF domain-containing protein [Vibrio sinensis]
MPMIKNKRQIQAIHPALRQAKMLLLVMTAILIVANFYLLSSARQLAQSYSDQNNQATWFLFQLNKEFSELVSMSRFSDQGENYRQETILHYELTWSRFDLLLHNREADNFMRTPGAEPFFSTLFDRFQQLEYALLQKQTPKNSAELHRSLKEIYQAMVTYVNTNFRVQSPLYKIQMTQAQQLAYAQYVLMLLLFVCAGLVSYIMHKEACFNKQLAMTDTLTGIPNRLAMMRCIKEKIDYMHPFTICLLDLNGFKQINDRHGHHAGDRVLHIIAQRVKRRFSVYRIGGDEFCIVIDTCDDANINMAFEELMGCFSDTIHLGSGINVSLSTSVGFARYPEDSLDYNALIRHADKNMYQMKFTRKAKAST